MSSRSPLYDDEHESHYSRRALPYRPLKDRLKIAQIPKQRDAQLTGEQLKVGKWIDKVIKGSPAMHPELRLSPEKQGVRLESEKNLRIFGGRQAGKTLAVATALRDAITDYKLSGTFVSAPVLFEMFTDAERNSGVLPDTYFDPHMLDYIRSKIDLVVIDDLGNEHITEFRKGAFQSFLAIRAVNLMPVVFTTRISDEDVFVERYGERAAEYLTPPNVDTIVIEAP